MLGTKVKKRLTRSPKHSLLKNSVEKVLKDLEDRSHLADKIKMLLSAMTCLNSAKSNRLNGSLMSDMQRQIGANIYLDKKGRCSQDTFETLRATGLLPGLNSLREMIRNLSNNLSPSDIRPNLKEGYSYDWIDVR